MPRFFPLISLLAGLLATCAFATAQEKARPHREFRSQLLVDGGEIGSQPRIFSTTPGKFQVTLKPWLHIPPNDPGVHTHSVRLAIFTSRESKTPVEEYEFDQWLVVGGQPYKEARTYEFPSLPGTYIVRFTVIRLDRPDPHDEEADGMPVCGHSAVVVVP